MKKLRPASRSAIFAVGGVLALAATPVEARDRFDIWLRDEAGLRTLVVENLETGAVAAAKGAEELDLLDTESAVAAATALRERDGAFSGSGPLYGDDGNRRIVVHAMDFDERDDSADDAGEARLRPSGQSAATDADETLADGALTDEAAGRRDIYKPRLSPARAAEFIDNVPGLDAVEKWTMKSRAGF